MNRWCSVPLATALGCFTALNASAADLRFNGFASIVGGMTVSEGDTTSARGKATFVADQPTGGIYDDDLSFKPDSIYGLQIIADLGQGLSITAQITGAGGQDFDAEVQWAYLSYELSDVTSLIAGKQRIPFYFYSDFLDVAYSYHWIRPPVEVYSVPVSAYEGAQVSHQFSAGNWDGRIQLYTGTANNTSPEGITFEMEDIFGLVGSIGNDWLQLRATYMVNKLAVEGSLYPNGGGLQDDDNPVGSTFIGVAAKADLGQWFAIAEYVYDEEDDPIGANFGLSSEDHTGWYISGGMRFGAFTPHLTYAQRETSLTADALGGALYTSDQTQANHSWTAGVRWDFHPSAALKAEYTTSSEESDRQVVAAFGDRGEVDVLTVGVDLVF